MRGEPQSNALRKGQPGWAIWALLGLFTLLYLIPLGVRPLVLPDELRYAEIPREMLVSGDWVVPRLNGLRYFEKPVLGYWLNAVSQWIFGPNAFSVRLPSALSAGTSAIAIFVMVYRFGGGCGAGVLAAAVLLTTVQVLVLGNINVLDGVLSLFLTGTMVAFFFAHMEERPRTKMALLALCGALCGLAFMTKGFLAFAVPVSAILPFLIWEDRWRDILRVFLPTAAVALLVVLPWSLIIHHREPDFWHYFFWTEHVKRFLSQHAQHPHPFWYFVPILAGGALPWTALLPAAVQGLKETRLKDPLLRFALCWFLFPFLFFSASQGKLIPYILPCFPPLAILISVGLRRYLGSGRHRAFTVGANALALLLVLAAFLLVIAQVGSLRGFRHYGPGEDWKWVVGAVGLLTWAAMLFFSGKGIASGKRLLLYGAAPVLLFFAGQFIVPDQVLRKKSPGAFLLEHSGKVGPESILVTDDQLVYAVCWYYGRQDARLIYKGGEVEYGLKYADSKDRFLDRDQFMKLIEKNPARRPVTLITARERYEEEYRTWTAAPAYEITDGVFLLAQF